MSTDDMYLQREGYTFIRVEPTEVAREIESLKLFNPHCRRENHRTQANSLADWQRVGGGSRGYHG